MKYTNLDYVQSILSSLGSDEINSVSDTTESLQVLDILKTTYFNMISRTLPPDHKQLIQLDPSLDVDMPTLMYVPQGIKSIEWIKYYDSNTLPNADDNGFEHDLNLDIDSSGGSIATPPPGYGYVTILPVRQYLDITSAFNPESDDVGTFTFTSDVNNFPGVYTFYYKNNKTPQYCTILSNYYVVFDGYDSAVDSTLQASKTMAYGLVTPTWSNEDSFIPDMDEQQVPLLLNEAKSLAFFELKQSPHPKAEQEAKRQWSAVQRDKAKHNSPSYFGALPDFGRRGMSPTRTFKDKGWDRY